MTPDFNKMNGLVPAIIQDASTKNILMLGFMDNAAYSKTCEEKRVTFFSRTKQRLWTKGERSGNYLHVKSIEIDCDNDTLLIKVSPEGAVCHTGTDTCFGETKNEGDFLFELEKLIGSRKNEMPKNSYTTHLFNKGLSKIAQKVGEEATEIVIASLSETDERLMEESADFLYHFLVLLAEKDVSLNDIITLLKNRHLAS